MHFAIVGTLDALCGDSSGPTTHHFDSVTCPKCQLILEKDRLKQELARFQENYQDRLIRYKTLTEERDGLILERDQLILERDQLREELAKEKVTRIKYQDLVYKICNILDTEKTKVTIQTALDELKKLKTGNFRDEAGRRTDGDSGKRLIWYSVNCTYWTDNWSKLKVSPIPLCPKCDSPGFQVVFQEWEAGIKKFEALGNPGYGDFLMEIKEKCHGRIKVRALWNERRK